MSKKRFDFEAVNGASLPHIAELIKQLLPDGHVSGDEWVAKNPQRADKHAGSFKVNLKTGAWADFAINDAQAKGRGAISLMAYVRGVSPKTAAKALVEMLSGQSSSMKTKTAGGQNTSNDGACEKEWTSIVPVPDDAAPIGKTFSKLRKPSGMWEYRDEQGELLCIVARFDRGNGEKSVLPYTYCQHRDGDQMWRQQALPVPRPLYNLPALAQKPEAPVLVVEGEKTASAAAAIFSDHVVLTSSGGASSAEKTDWSKIRGREVVIWPDNDAVGQSYARHVAQLCLTHGAVSAAIVAVPDDFPQKWDLADAPPERWGKERLCALLNEVKPFLATVTPPIIETNATALNFEEPTQAEILLALAANGVYFHTPDGIPCVDACLQNEQRRTYPVDSRDAREWLTHLFYSRTGDAPSPEAMKKAISALCARAKFAGEKHTVFIRVGAENGRTYIDLCDETGGVIEIDTLGWRIIKQSPVRFFRKKGMLPLPVPTQGGTLEMLRPYVNVRDDNGFVLIIAWLLMALRELDPYPVLVLTGEHGTSKSTLSKILRKLVDPNFSALQTLTKEHDIFISAKNGWVLAFDNLSYLPDELSDTLCRISTGGGYATRSLYTDDDEQLFEAMRPIMLNGIGNVVTRGDLADRALVVPLQPIMDDERKTEKEFWQEFEAVLPSILGAFLDMVAHGMREFPNVVLSGKPRMADFAKWITACETAVWPKGTFMNALAANSAEATDYVIQASPLASAICAFMEDRETFEDSATELWERLTARVDQKITKDKRLWPSTPRVMSEWFKRVAPHLRKIGIEINNDSRGSRGKRLVHVTNLRFGGSAPPAPFAPELIAEANGSGSEQTTANDGKQKKLPKYARKLPAQRGEGAHGAQE